MAWSIGRRVIHLVLVILIVTFATMMLVDRVPGGLAHAILGDTATQEQIDTLNHTLKLDESYAARYTGWLGDVATGDFGTSPRTNRPVLDTIRARLPVTIELVVLTELLAFMLAIPIGMYTAHREGKRLDRLWSLISSALIAVPSFVLALVLVYFFAVRWHVFPVNRFRPISKGLFDNLRSVALPVVTLAVAEVAVYSRVLRADAVTTMRQDYMLAARSRGLSPARLMFRHALRPSSLSLVTLGALSVGRLIGGTVVVETIFGLPGLGSLMIDSVLNSDLVVVQGIVLFVALVYVGLNLILDVTYGSLDPRVRSATA